VTLPLDLDHLSYQDQTLSFAGMSWADYEKFDYQEYPGYRVSYYNGVITLVSPSQNHEVIAEVINYLIVAYCKQMQLLYYPMRSTRLVNKPLAGKEPDVSFSLGSRKKLPDLAVEVIFSSGSIDDLKKYQALGVSEVWFWQNNQLTFYHLTAGKYIEVANSICLPNLGAEELASFVNRGLTESPLTIELDFLRSIQ
ncbi:MAG: Uma2 family endonuclease, partial [Cyanobacteria bacterium P01_E01_bin.35]